MTLRLRLWLAVLLPVLAYAQAPGPAPAQAPAAPAAAGSAGAPGAPVQKIDPNSYIIGPGDTLQVYVWREQELTATVPVRPDGKISTPLNEDMVAVGKTPSQLARDIEKVLSEYVRSPTVNVIVTQPMAVFSQIQVIGQVTKPGSLPYRAGMKVLDAVLAAGGLTQFAAGNRARISRVVDGKQQQIKLKLDALMNKGEMSQNVELRPGDVVVVPESLF